MKKKINLFALMVCVLLMMFAFSLSACNDTNNQQSHDFGEWELTTAPTCETLGEETRVSKTDQSIFETRSVTANGHEWGDFVIELEPTCLVAGVESRVCEHDEKHIDKRSIAPLNHAFDVWDVLVAPTCLTTGTESSVCTHDNSHIETRVIAALGHDFGEWVTEIASTCTTIGTETRICRNDCNHTELRNVSALGHDFNDWCVMTIPTCTVDGEKTRFCKNDITHTETLVIDATDHDFGDWVTITASTETTDGEEIRVCRNDKNHIESRILYATGTVGALYFYTENDAEYIVGLSDYKINSIIIPAYYEGLPVTSISAYGFSFSLALENVTFVDGSRLKNIGDSAFMGCENLINIDLPESIERISDFAFYMCEELTDIIIPESVNYVGYNAFQLFTQENPVFIHIRAVREKTLGWDSDWYIDWGEVYNLLAIYNSTHQYGEAQPQFYTANYVADSGGRVNNYSSYKQFVLSGESVNTVVAQSYIGYKFIGWSDGIMAIERTDTNIHSDFTVTANFVVDLMGEGTQSSPYLISDYEDLKKIVAFPDSHFLLTSDIDLTGKSFRPLFYIASNPFNGVFDGGGKTISNMTIKAPSETLIRPYYQFPSLFGVVGEYGAVKNLNIIDFDITILDFDTTNYSKDISPLSVGGLAGICIGNLNNVNVSGKIRGNGLSYDGIAIGGLAGQMMDNGANNCHADVEITLDGFTFTGVRRYAFNIGGLFGIANTDIINCSANSKIFIDNMIDPNDNGTIVLGSYSGVSVGGLVGMYYTLKEYLPESVTISGCNTVVDISVNCRSHVGGLVAFISTSSVFTISDCYTSGQIHHGGAVSGFINTLDVGEGSVVENCGSTVDILSAASGSGFIGVTQSDGSGLTLVDGNGNRIGNGPIRISNCYATGDITASSAMGFSYGLSYTDVYNCYFTGNVNSPSNVAYGFCGQIRNCKIVNSYVLGNVTGYSSGAGFASLALDTEIYRCYFSGTASGGHCSGFIRTVNRAKLKECFATGTVTSIRPTSSTLVSGLIGAIQGSNVLIENCYSLCDIFFVETTDITVVRSGGLIGRFMTSGNAMVSNCYYAGKIQGICAESSIIGGVAGETIGSGSVVFENCHWLYHDEGLAKQSIGRDAAGNTTVNEIQKHDNVSEILLLSDTLNGDNQEIVWVNIDGRPPQLLFMLP